MLRIIYKIKACCNFFRFSKKNKESKHTLIATVFFVFLTIMLGLYQIAYQINLENNRQLFDVLRSYYQAMHVLHSTDIRLTAVLPALNSLHDAECLCDQATWRISPLWASHRVCAAIHAALNRTLQLLFLSRVAANLEGLLSHGDRDPRVLYADLMGYLAFGQTHHLDPQVIRIPMQQQWARLYAHDRSLRQQLNYYMERSSDGIMKALPIDRFLVNKVHSQLRRSVQQNTK